MNQALRNLPQGLLDWLRILGIGEFRRLVHIAPWFVSAHHEARSDRVSSSPERVSCERGDTETNKDSALSPIHVRREAPIRDQTGNGAGEGNRTLVLSLGSFCSTIELHPLFACIDYSMRNR